MLPVFKNGTSVQYFWPCRPIHIITVIFVSLSELQAGSPNRIQIVKSQMAIQVNFSQITFGERKRGGEVILQTQHALNRELIRQSSSRVARIEQFPNTFPCSLQKESSLQFLNVLFHMYFFKTGGLRQHFMMQLQDKRALYYNRRFKVEHLFQENLVLNFSLTFWFYDSLRRR